MRNIGRSTDTRRGGAVPGGRRARGVWSRVPRGTDRPSRRWRDVRSDRRRIALTVGPGSSTIELVADCGLSPNGAAIGPDGKVYVCNNGGPLEGYQGGLIQRVDPATGEVDDLYTHCDGNRLSGPNDIVFDLSGNFWFTDTGKFHPRHADRGGIYRAAADGSKIEEVIYPLNCPNGIGLAPGDKAVYWAEMFTRRLFEHALPLTAETPDLIRPAGPVCGLPGNIQFDSLALEADGKVCVGTIGVGGIAVIDPSDGSFEHYRMPEPFDDMCVTNICFGGDDMSTAFITLGSTGRVASCRWPRPGLRLAF